MSNRSPVKVPVHLFNVKYYYNRITRSREFYYVLFGCLCDFTAVYFLGPTPRYLDIFLVTSSGIIVAQYLDKAISWIRSE